MNDTYETFEELYMDLALVIALVKVQHPNRMDDIRALIKDTSWVRPDLRLVPHAPNEAGQIPTKEV